MDNYNTLHPLIIIYNAGFNPARTHVFITSLDLDFLFLTETWLKNEEHTQFHELCPQNDKYFSKPRHCCCFLYVQSKLFQFFAV